MNAINDAQARLDQALIEGVPTTPIRAELAQLEEEMRLAADREAAIKAAEATCYRARITMRGVSIAGDAASRINSMMAALAPAFFPLPKALATGVAP